MTFCIFIFSRADLANLVNEAALLAGRKNKVVVEKIDFIHAVERSIAVSLSLSNSVCVRLSVYVAFIIILSYAFEIYNLKFEALTDNPFNNVKKGSETWLTAQLMVPTPKCPRKLY